MKKPQWITIAVALILTITIFMFARTVPHQKIVAEMHSADDGHDHGDAEMGSISIDSVLDIRKKELNPQQVAELAEMERPLISGNPAIGGQALRDEQIKAYHALEHFWRDTARYFPGFIWYKAEAARLENSEKSLTFAAHLILNNLQEGHDPDPAMIRWKGFQAKDLFERSLRINPDNDSSKVGLGACYMFGNIPGPPMAGIQHIRDVVQKDSTNIYAQMMLVKGSLVSGQFDNAISRLNTVCRIQPDNLEALLLLADLYEQKGDKKQAIQWYRKSLSYIKRPDMKEVVEQRIGTLEN